MKLINLSVLFLVVLLSSCGKNEIVEEDLRGDPIEINTRAEGITIHEMEVFSCISNSSEETGCPAGRRITKFVIDLCGPQNVNPGWYLYGRPCPGSNWLRIGQPDLVDASNLIFELNYCRAMASSNSSWIFFAHHTDYGLVHWLPNHSTSCDGNDNCGFYHEVDAFQMLSGNCP